MHIKFATDDAFHREVNQRVHRYLRYTGRRPRDVPRMYFKTATILFWTAASYAMLVFWAPNIWFAVLLGVSLAMAVTAIGFNIQHDGGHRGYSSSPMVNRWMARTLDLCGGSSFVWDHKHNSLHHTYANVDGHDDDIDVGWLGRLAPQQRRLFFHRVQHYYMWFLYAFLPLKWHLVDDFVHVAQGRIGSHRFARPRGMDLAVFIGGKVVFFALVLGLPSLFHPFWVVLLFYVGVSCFQGVVLSVTFQLAHVVEGTAFPTPEDATGRLPSHWAVHQVQTTANFAPDNPIVTWYVGGLNHQIEHHLFPRICHLHYPRLARIVERACRRHGLEYQCHPTVASGIASHFRWLRTMGRGTSAVA